METIRALQIRVDAYKVKQAILQTKKLKLKEQVTSINLVSLDGSGHIFISICFFFCSGSMLKF